ncbi:MAG: glycoside hydrolase family 3 N-terminal domain-containing protein [Acidimicrobiales bacterium]
MALAIVVTLVVAPWWAASRSGDGVAVDDTADPAAGAELEPRPVTAAPEVGPEELSDCAQAVADLPSRSRVAMVVMVGVDGDDPAGTRGLLAGPDRPGGVFVRPGAQLWEEGVLAAPPPDDLPLVVAVDDEGGRVQPLAGVLDDLPSAAVLAGRSDAELELLAEERGEQLRSLGVTAVFGPVVDVGSGGGIGDRSFGDEAPPVIASAAAYARGLRAAGVLPVVKHFPGHGRASADTHDAPSQTPELADLRAVDLVPYDALMAEAPLGVMVGHLDVPGLTPDGVPASLSADAIGLLRGAYEFDGLVVTDDLAAMDAVRDRFTVPEAAERALLAGVDLVLLSQPTDVGAVLDRLEQAVASGRVPERRLDAAVARVAAAGCRG